MRDMTGASLRPHELTKSSWTKRMRSLLCEDQDAIRHMIGTLVTAAGHKVVEVRTGAEAVELALKERFDILLLDLMLPGALDGFEVCTRLQADECTRTM